MAITYRMVLKIIIIFPRALKEYNIFQCLYPNTKTQKPVQVESHLVSGLSAAVECLVLNPIQFT